MTARAPPPNLQRTPPRRQADANLSLSAASVYLLLVPILAANAVVGRAWASQAGGALAGLAAGATILFGALDLAGARIISSEFAAARLGLDLGSMVTGLVAAPLASRFVRERLARILAVNPDNPVHALALAFAVILLGTQVSSIAFTDVLASARSQPALTLGDLVFQELPFLILAYAGVGLFLRRGMRQATIRLGVVRPTWWQATSALAASGVFFAFGQAMDGLGQHLTPDVARQVADTTQHLFGGLGGPWAIAALALAPGICEELLFRGALQPRLGLLVAALLFTALHTQYGLSFDALAVFVIALGLGFIRKYTNTSTSCLCHVTYNLLAAIGIAGPAVGVALAAEAALIAYSAYGIWSLRRRPPARP